MAELTPAPVLEKMEESLATNPDAKILAVCNKRRDAAIKDRRRYEPTWHLCQAFIANRQWVGWAPGGARGGGRIVALPNPGDRERHTENICTQYLWTAIGKLYIEDFKPNLLFRREDIESEDFATQANRALEWAWNEEITADEQILDAILKMGTYGLAGLRCFYDPTRGQPLGQMPVGPDGQPITDMDQARQYVAQAQASGQQVPFRSVYEGKIIWEPLSPFNILPPPGVEHERWFPWIIVERPLPTETIKKMYPDVADRINDQDMTAVDMVGLRDLPVADANDPGAAVQGKLEGHAMLSTMYELPTSEYPAGREIIWTNKTLCAINEKLPYELNGEPHHGIVFLKYHRIPNRFWPVGIIEPLLGVQRQRNRARSQMIEMKDRAGLGRVYAHKGTLSVSNRPKGKIMEVIEIPLGMQFPQETTGTGPGPWIEAEARMLDEAADRIAGFREVSLGQAPAGVSAYSAMALLQEQDDKRIGPILKMIRTAVGDATKLTLRDIRQYWPPQKQIALAGPSGQIESFLFNAAKLPEMVYVEIPKGAAKPQSPAAMIQLIFDMWNAAIAGGQPLKRSWLSDSLAQGRPMPVPRDEEDQQRRAAELEDHLMMTTGQLIQPQYFDDDFVHVKQHRQEQQEASGAGNLTFAQLLEQHIQLHLENAQQKASAAPSNSPMAQGPQGAAGGPQPAGQMQPPAAGGNIAFTNNLSAPYPPRVR